MAEFRPSSGEESQPATSNPKPQTSDPNILIIDNIGMLSRLYRYAAIAYGRWLWRGMACIMCWRRRYTATGCLGPVYDKYIEAAGLVEAGAASALMVRSNSRRSWKTCYRTKRNSKRKGAQPVTTYMRMAALPAGSWEYIQEKRLLTSR